MRIALVFFFLLCGIGAFAESREAPSPHKNKIRDSIGKGYQNQTTHTALNTSFPLRVQIVPPSKNDPERYTYEAEQRHKSNIELGTISIAVATAIILIAQLFVFGLQARRLRETVEATEKAAEAAQKSAAVLPLIERAYVIVGVGIETGKIIISFKNHGRTPAILTRIYADIGIQKTKPEEIGEESLLLIPPGIVIGTGDRYPIDITQLAKKRISQIKGKRPEWDKNRLICLGRVEYKDVIGDDRSTTFCWEFSRSYKCFRISHHETLNQTT